MLDARLVLLVEDTLSLARVYLRYLEQAGLSALHAASLVEAGDMFARHKPDIVLCDLHLPDGDGMSLIGEVRRSSPSTVIVVITSNSSVETAVSAIRAGADDFLTKPFDAPRLETTIGNALERRRLSRVVEILGGEADGDRFEGFIGADMTMRAVYRVIDMAARSTAPVFITGENGTGKELCAEAIHRRGTRQDKPLVAVNCAAIPRDLVEAELFGHARGAFTGAVRDRVGLVAQADGGTLFLDELCEMDLSTQAKLLRFAQTGTIQPVGGAGTVQVDVRLVCATNRNPLEEVRAGRFREDLYYRLHVLPIHLPPLRERGRDVLLIVRHLLARIAEQEGTAPRDLGPDAEDRLLRSAWPGNIRQLQNTLRSVVVLNDALTITAAMLPDDPPGGTTRTAAAAGHVEGRGPAPGRLEDGAIIPLAEVERETVERAIRLCGGNLSKAAQKLGINVSTIHRKRRAWSGSDRLD
ncbi:ATPase AAA [Skermanella stibiiresistens SB22]|uniref:ATPase AAA n=1 Tax=Skermanella stibiiresistens SB22 TaxID=1385369 RepID=W9HAE6_9PROT|nr:sigma-54 dependent transcriptional regulator [Skermanella stibiiresistens]EWY41657.1 ATPase AAA [Skermanella stibiiresistens SB22]